MPRILLVDDDATLLDLLRRYLERQGYEVKTSSSAEEALGVFDADRDTLLVADLTLPGMTGEQLLRELRRKRPALTGVITSGYPYESQLFGSRFLQKPFMPQALVAEIEKLLKD
jgi:DNA-binding response OmpR family regulator